ncbi:hypothetical protein V1517DRAFT_259408 [Lipomyces orientalis]|uniref:Uncharacterized protein n=1 Tax=Lipomyces orientalis TaxID=1233043 RepID=A0ACC3TQ68_9ASCO
MATLESPLVRVERGSLQPKIIGLYQQLFKEGAKAPETDGFWVEFFILKANPSALSVILEGFSAEDLLQMQGIAQTVFTRGVRSLSDSNPAIVANAMETLTILIREILAKQLTSSEVITVLVGLDRVDREFMVFVDALERIMRTGSTNMRIAALRATLSTVCCTYKTSLINFFIQRDLFPVLVQIIYDDATTSHTFEAFVLLGVLSNYDKLESYNPYQTRLADFVDESVMQKIVVSIGKICKEAREEYIAVADDAADGFSLESMFSSYSGLARRAKSALLQQDPQMTANSALAHLPPLSAAILLATSNFVQANKFFSQVLIETKTVAQEETPFGSYVSFSSYLLQHQHRSERHACYARLAMLVHRILVEDPIAMQKLVSIECRSSMRLCRQRQPCLPFVKGERFLIEGVLDALIGAVDHNMKRALDVPMYILTIGTIQRVISQLKRLRIRLKYHWSELWKSIFSFLRFITVSYKHLRGIQGMPILIDDTIRVLVLAFSAGEAFLSGAADYDDLFYKLIETGELLTKLSTVYDMPREHSSIGTLISISEHYHNLIKERSMFSSGHLSSEQVSDIIKSGYDTLSISAQQGIDYWDRYRESDERVFLKRIGWVAVVDAQELLGRKLLPNVDTSNAIVTNGNGIYVGNGSEH